MFKRKNDIVQNIIIFLLLAASPILFSIFISQNLPKTVKSEATFDRLWIVGNSAESIDYDTRADLTLPIELAYKSDDRLLGVYADDALISTIYNEFDNVITSIFGKNSVIVNSELDYNSAFDLIDEASGLIWFRYASSLPYSIICACAAGSEAIPSDFPSALPIYVEAIAMLTSDNGEKTTAHMLLFDGEGEVYEATQTDGSPITISYADTAYLDAYSDSFSDAQFIFTPSSHIPQLSFDVLNYLELKSEINSDLIDSERVSRLAELFGMNTEKTGSYTDHANSTVYVSSSASLKCTSDGRVIFDSDADGELSLKKLLGYSKPGQKRYDLFDMLNAAVKITETVTDLLPELSDSSSLRITSFSKDTSGYIVIELSRFYNGIRIQTEPYLFTFSRTGLVSASFGYERFEALSERKNALPLSMVYARIVSEYTNPHRVEPIYALSDAGIYSLSYAVG